MSDKDILELIKERRSVRRFKSKMPPGLAIQKMLEAGCWAPSGLNNQPWRFKVISDKIKKDSLAKFTRYSDVIYSAPFIIIVCMSLEDSYHREKDLMAIGACIENILLEAHSLGLGACWLGEILNKKKEVAEFLGLKDGLEIMAVLAAGYPDEKVLKGIRQPLNKFKI